MNGQLTKEIHEGVVVECLSDLLLQAALRACVGRIQLDKGEACLLYIQQALTNISQDSQDYTLNLNVTVYTKSFTSVQFTDGNTL